MKKLIWLLAAILCMLILVILCLPSMEPTQPASSPSAPTVTDPSRPSTSLTHPENTVPTTQPQTTPQTQPVLTGWQELDGKRYYFTPEGKLYTGWLEWEGCRYYLGADGAMHTGWLELDGRRYYLRENGVMARGCLEIEGVKHYFTSTGESILLVNPWNYVPEGYDPQLVNIQKYASYNNLYISSVCYDALMQMLSDCQSQCGRAMIVSAHRTQEFQAGNFERKVQFYVNQGYDRAKAEELAAKVVARPGTSEHQLGLALDIVDAAWPYLEEAQENQPVQKWLMEHSWEYGFILRYPKGTTEVTGIIYEPWHYRYVGKELAKELYELGITLEEYLDGLTQ